MMTSTVVGIIVLVAESALIAGLLVQSIRRRRAEGAKLEVEGRTSAILRAIPDLMFVMAPDGTYLDYYARDPADLYAPPERFLGRTIQELMPPDLAATFMDALRRAQLTSEPIVVEYSLPIQGILRAYEARLVCDEQRRIVSIVRDVTDQQINRDMLHRRDSALRASNDRNRDLAGRLIASQEAERERIARELHDDLSQKLALLNIDLDQLTRRLEHHDSELAAEAGVTRQRAAEIASDVHELSHQLHPSKLKMLGLIRAMEGVCRDVAVQNDITVDFTHESIPVSVSPATSLCLYRILQEALHNVAKHSGANRADVRLVRERDTIFMRIDDQGAGFDPEALGGTGLGLVSMRERVNHLGGRLTIGSAPGAGTRISVHLPLILSVESGAAQLARTAESA
ncbi:MAG TPA: ATP-binding protein [Vicinamibacterales bacterium]